MPIEPFKGVFPPVAGDEGCQCERCFRARHAGKDYYNTFFFARMFLCETCGNKRCPHATDHNLACTNSNAEGQKGSS